jgi:hypothetical protein
MGHTNYCTLRGEMNKRQWSTYQRLMQTLYTALEQEMGLRLVDTDDGEKRSPSPPVASRSRVYFEGFGLRDPSGCEPFQVQRNDFLVKRLHGTSSDPDIYCKTLLEPYDFAVKCALILLAECGGALRISSDYVSYYSANAWLEVLNWLKRQSGLPDAYPVATYLLVAGFDFCESQEAYDRLALDFERGQIQPWLVETQEAYDRAPLDFEYGLVDFMTSTKPMADTDECPMCYDSLLNPAEAASTAAVVRYCPECKNGVHRACILKWFEHAPRRTCVCCRSAVWVNYNDE